MLIARLLIAKFLISNLAILQSCTIVKPIIISGIQPTGPLHVGNYLGALKNFVDLQNSGKYECFFFIADLHSLTEYESKKELEKNTHELMASFLAAGLDQKKSTLFRQSQAPAHTNLAWIFNTITPMGELERMTQYKDKVSRGISASAGLFDYPVLMAADILIYKATVVPVGDDQDQHLELTRTIARNFNKKFGMTFPEPKPLHTKSPRVMSLDKPNEKMSKSSPRGCLFLIEEPAVIKEKIKRAVTDSQSNIVYEPEKRPGISNLILIYSEFANLSVSKTIQQFKNTTYSKFKEKLYDLIVEKLKPFQLKQKELSKNKELIVSAFSKGAIHAKKIAHKTLEEAREKVGLLKQI